MLTRSLKAPPMRGNFNLPSTFECVVCSRLSMSTSILRVDIVHCVGRLATRSQVPQPTCFWKWVSKAVRSRNPTTRRVSCSTKGALNRGGRGRVGDNTLRTPHAHCTTAIPSFNVGGGIGSLAHTTHSNVLSGLKILLCRWRCSEEDIPSKYQTLNYELF